MLQNWYADLADSLGKLKKNNAFRHRRRIVSAQGPIIDVDGKKLVNFSSNDYLGLANHAKVKEALVRGVDRYGVGAGASHLVVGHSEAHTELEQQLARFTGRDKAIVFSSGYMANLGVIQTLAKSGTSVFSDRLNHASLVDACLASSAKLCRYAHSDCEHLQQLLVKHDHQYSMLVTDGVFSMDGDCAPLAELANIARQDNLMLMVDDAHGFGVLGENGRGSAEHFGLDQDALPLLMGTFGKAIGVAGAFVAGRSDLIETLIQRARNYIYTTALPPALASAISASLQIIDAEPERRAHLRSLASRLREGIASFGLGADKFENQPVTPIVPVHLGSNERALALSEYLQQRGVLAIAIRPPTVPAGTARLRLSVSAAHTPAHIDQLLGVLASGLMKLG